MAHKPGAAVVSCRRGGATAALDQLNKYFTIAQMPVVSSNYWNMVHGNTPEEVCQERRLTDHAYFRSEYGMDVKMYRSREEQWCGSAGGRGEGEDELYTVMDIFVSVSLNVLLDFGPRIQKYL